MELSFYLLAIKVAVVAFIYSEVLTESGMLLNPIYVWLDTWYLNRCSNKKVIPEWIFKPLIGCFRCVSGQMALWVFLVENFEKYSNIKTIFECSELVGNHIFFISITIFLAWVLSKVYAR